MESDDHEEGSGSCQGIRNDANGRKDDDAVCGTADNVEQRDTEGIALHGALLQETVELGQETQAKECARDEGTQSEADAPGCIRDDEGSHDD
eukprot:CAMPEP_0170641750 /NCGR_PEP_ID=MMETSP0224-20130122/40948_1 /TAXON_ID=285029 /ORGANISM="Togula jolla, Strain CCCM 725" /LENGTH=91 /DNA_ID=CAMNT_0010972391 /DNA_START=63 /DNA_END=338 /DNA_ORIENTATION=-